MKWDNVKARIAVRVILGRARRWIPEYLRALFAGFWLIGSIVGLVAFWVWVFFG